MSLYVLVYESNPWPRAGSRGRMLALLVVLECKGHRNRWRLRQNCISDHLRALIGGA